MATFGGYLMVYGALKIFLDIVLFCNTVREPSTYLAVAHQRVRWLNLISRYLRLIEQRFESFPYQFFALFNFGQNHGCNYQRNQIQS